MDIARCSLGKFLVVPTFVTRRLHIYKDARDAAVKDGNICRVGFPIILH